MLTCNIQKIETTIKGVIYIDIKHIVKCTFNSVLNQKSTGYVLCQIVHCTDFGQLTVIIHQQQLS